MARTAATRKVLVCEAVGFLAVIVLLWVNELLDLPDVMFRTGPTPANWSECLVESIVVGFLGFLVLFWSDLLLTRIRYLEGFLPVCRHCRRIRVGDEWMSFETYMAQYEEEAASYGLCPDCRDTMRCIEASAGSAERSGD
jgi:hypothetical protein